MRLNRKRNRVNKWLSYQNPQKASDIVYAFWGLVVSLIKIWPIGPFKLLFFYALPFRQKPIEFCYAFTQKRYHNYCPLWINNYLENWLITLSIIIAEVHIKVNLHNVLCSISFCLLAVENSRSFRKVISPVPTHIYWNVSDCDWTVGSQQLCIRAPLLARAKATYLI